MICKGRRAREFSLKLRPFGGCCVCCLFKEFLTFPSRAVHNRILEDFKFIIRLIDRLFSIDGGVSISLHPPTSQTLCQLCRLPPPFSKPNWQHFQFKTLYAFTYHANQKQEICYWKIACGSYLTEVAEAKHCFFLPFCLVSIVSSLLQNLMGVLGNSIGEKFRSPRKHVLVEWTDLNQLILTKFTSSPKTYKVNRTLWQGMKYMLASWIYSSGFSLHWLTSASFLWPHPTTPLLKNDQIIFILSE